MQPLHPFNEIRLRRFQCEVVMIAHDHERTGPPAELHRGLAQRHEEGMFRTGRRGMNVVLQIITIDHMIAGSRILKANATCRPSGSAGSSDPHQLRRCSIWVDELPLDSHAYSVGHIQRSAD